MSGICLIDSSIRGSVELHYIERFESAYSGNLTNRWFANLLPFLWGETLATSSPKCIIVTRPTSWRGRHQPIRGPGQGWGPIRRRQGVKGPQTGNGDHCVVTDWVGNCSQELNFQFLTIYIENIFNKSTIICTKMYTIKNYTLKYF